MKRLVLALIGLCLLGAMIGYAGLELFAGGQRDDMALLARPRWPLDQTRPGMLGSGKKGAKA